MQRMKRWIAFVLMIAMVLCLAGCQKEEEKEETIADKYIRAQTLMSKNQFADAAVVFDQLGSYEESGKLSMYCKAADAGEKGDYDTAVSAFESLGEYKDSQFMIIYYRAKEQESDAFERSSPGSFLDAIKLYDTIPLFRDSKGRAEACRKGLYDWAVQNAVNGNILNSIIALDRLGNYSDSANLSRYYQALDKETSGDYTGASAAFASLGDYRDAAEQVTKVLQRGYEKAEALEMAGKQDEAYQLFISLGDYSDSFERACKPYSDVGVEKK